MGLLSRAGSTASEPASGEKALNNSSSESFDQKIPRPFEDEIVQFHQMHINFNCIVLENPETITGKAHSTEKADFCEKVSKVIDKTGTVVPLPQDRPLILLPLVMDRELIAHRLSKTLKTNPLLSFEANNPGNVLNRIDSLI